MTMLDPNAIGLIGAAAVTGLFALLGTISAKLTRNSGDTKDMKNVVQQAADNAQTAVDNTSNVSNGFVGRMDRKLDTVIRNQDSLQVAFREHLEWHLNKEAQK